MHHGTCIGANVGSITPRRLNLTLTFSSITVTHILHGLPLQKTPPSSLLLPDDARPAPQSADTGSGLRCANLANGRVSVFVKIGERWRCLCVGLSHSPSVYVHLRNGSVRSNTPQQRPGSMRKKSHMRKIQRGCDEKLKMSTPGIRRRSAN